MCFSKSPRVKSEATGEVTVAGVQKMEMKSQILQFENQKKNKTEGIGLATRHALR